jgi:hypothetical protein
VRGSRIGGGCARQAPIRYQQRLGETRAYRRHNRGSAAAAAWAQGLQDQVGISVARALRASVFAVGPDGDPGVRCVVTVIDLRGGAGVHGVIGLCTMAGMPRVARMVLWLRRGGGCARQGVRAGALQRSLSDDGCHRA